MKKNYQPYTQNDHIRNSKKAAIARHNNSLPRKYVILHLITERGMESKEIANIFSIDRRTVNRMEQEHAQDYLYSREHDFRCGLFIVNEIYAVLIRYKVPSKEIIMENFLDLFTAWTLPIGKEPRDDVHLSSEGWTSSSIEEKENNIIGNVPPSLGGGTLPNKEKPNR